MDTVRSNQVSKLLGDYVLRGWTLMAEGCPMCYTPLVGDRRSTQRIYCVNCDCDCKKEGEEIVMIEKERKKVTEELPKVPQKTMQIQQQQQQQEQGLIQEDEEFWNPHSKGKMNSKIIKEDEDFVTTDFTKGELEAVLKFQQHYMESNPSTQPTPVPKIPEVLPKQCTFTGGRVHVPTVVDSMILSNTIGTLCSQLENVRKQLENSSDLNEQVFLCKAITTYGDAIEALGKAKKSIIY